MAPNDGCRALDDDARSGKPRRINDERVAHVMKTSSHTRTGNGSTHRSSTVSAWPGTSRIKPTARYFQDDQHARAFVGAEAASPRPVHEGMR
jgi:hypothetical protein